MFTVVESISLAGDRAKQNDDALGFANNLAWVIDGATDLHNAPLTDAASDAAWLAHAANAYFHAHANANDEAGLRALVRGAAEAASSAFQEFTRATSFEKWQSPICSLLIAAETDDGALILDLGDCRVFAKDLGGGYEGGGPELAADTETKLASQAQERTSGPLLHDAQTINMLRDLRARQNGGGLSWTFSLAPECATHARVWRLPLQRPAHILLATDGLSALSDRYERYDAAAFVEAARSRGLQDLGRDLRGIEAADSGGSRHPRFKISDDATGLLMRLS